MKKEQVEEWLENPVTLFLLAEAKKELEEIKNTPITDCLVVGKPNKTHENLVELEARETAWNDWVGFLEGNWNLFEDSYE